MALLLRRIACRQRKDAAYCYRWSVVSVCLCVCLLDTTMSLLTQYFPLLGKLTSKCQEWVNRATTRLAVAIGSEDRRSSQR